MAVGFKNSSGVDLDDVFELGQGNKLVNMYASNGQDLGQRYLDVGQGSAASNQGFRNSVGTDFGHLFCAKGTNISFYLTFGESAVTDNYDMTSRLYGYVGYTRKDDIPYEINIRNCSFRPDIPLGSLSNNNVGGFNVLCLYDIHNNSHGTWLTLAGNVPWGKVRVTNLASGRSIDLPRTAYSSKNITVYCVTRGEGTVTSSAGAVVPFKLTPI